MKNATDNLMVPGSLWNASVSYITNSASINDQRHYCYKVAAGIDYAISCEVDKKNHKGIKGFIVNQRKLHRCDAPDGPVLNNLVEPDSVWGKRIKILLNGKDFMRFEDIVDPDSIETILPKGFQHMEDGQLIPGIEALMSRLTNVQDEKGGPVDERIKRVVKYISQHLGSKISKQDILDLTFLSFERTRHLFTEQMGIPFSRYILWQRLRRTLKEAVARKSTLTAISEKYGFSDLSHFNRTFRRIFGFNPSSFLQQSRVII